MDNIRNLYSMSLSSRGLSALGFDKIFRKMGQARDHREGGEPPQRAQRSVGHGLTQIAEQHLLRSRIPTGHQPADSFDAEGRADAAWRAFAAGLDGAELHRVAGLCGHI